MPPPTQSSLAAFGFVKSPSKKAASTAPGSDGEPSAKRVRTGGAVAAPASPAVPPAPRSAAARATIDVGPDGIPLQRDPALAAKWARRVASDDLARPRPGAADATAAPAAAAAPAAPTPLDRQVAALQAANPGTLLAVEVGYKYVFFGRDADAAAAELRLFLYSERGAARASVPAPGLARAVRRLVGAGHRVGIVRQTETAALKKAGAGAGPRGGTFARAVAAVYTAATLDAGAEADVGSPAAGPSRGAGGGDAAAAAGGGAYLLAVADEPAGDGSDRALLGAVAVDVASGDVRCGGGMDAAARPALERLLMTLAPAEILVLGAPTRATRRALDAYVAGSHRGGSGGGAVRCEDVRGTSPAAARAAVASFFGGAPGGAGALPPLSDPAAVALAAVLAQLAKLKLAAPLAALGGAGVLPLDPDGALALPPSALAALEILAPTGGAPGARGSLLWLVDRTRTAAGRRALRDWLARPLADPAAVNARLDAVDELRRVAGGRGVAAVLAALPPFLAGAPDVARGLTRALHRTASPAEFVATATTLARAADTLGVVPVEGAGDDDGGGAGAAHAAHFPGVCSSLLRRLLASVVDARVRAVAAAALAPLDVAAAGTGDRVALLADGAAFPRTAAAKAAVAAARADLDALLPSLKAAAPGAKGYVSVANQGTHLLELPAGARAPADWARVSSTKKVDRYLPPAVGAGLDALAVATETLAAAAAAEWAAHAASLAPEYGRLRAAAGAVAALDALLALADAAESEGWVRPTLLPDDGAPPCLDLEGVVHPMLAASARAAGGAAVPNDVRLGGGGADGGGGTPPPRVLVVTGPNMGGKSCTTRAVALAVLMAHAGCHVAAARAALSPVDAVMTRMGAADALLLARSTFLQEMAETADILRTATPRSLVLFDELGRGTSTADGAAIAAAVLEHVAAVTRCRALFVTHFHRLCGGDGGDGADTPLPPGVAVAHMAADVAADPASGAETVTFRYTLAPGACPRSYGVHCARLAGLPPAVVARAGDLAASLAAGQPLSVGGGLPAAVADAVRAAVAAADAGAVDDTATSAAAAV